VNPAIVDALLSMFRPLLPEIVLGLTACVLFVGSAFQPERRLWSFFAMFGLVAAAAVLVPIEPTALTDAQVYAAPIALDRLGILVKWIAILGGGVLLLASWNEVPQRQSGEYFGCLLLIVAGLSLTGSANELVTLFLSLELISIPTYVLLYLPKNDTPAQEAATKYFLLSVFSTAFLLFGFSYLYGLTGTTNIPALIDAMDQTRAVKPPSSVPVPALALAALVMIVVGLGFKITAVPFHFYAPDVYQGTSTVVAATLAFVPKVAGFVAFFRILGFVLPRHTAVIPTVFGSQMPILLWILAAVTMTLGNILALLQSNLKRLLAYSSVAHAGYMLIGLAVAYNLGWPTDALEGQPQGEPLAAIPAGVQSVLFYLVAYGAMTVGAFCVIAYLSTPERPVEVEDDLAGLGTSHPGIALVMAIFLFSLIGMPLTAGFAGKWLLFFDALSVEGDRAVQFRWLAGVGAINAAIGGWYYLRILAKMYLHTSVKPLATPKASPALMAMWVCAALTLFLGIYPQPFVRLLTRP
jgi:NADH-quinone oxidoreductase subunit N